MSAHCDWRGEAALPFEPLGAAILQQLQADGLDLGLFWTTEEFERLLGEGTHAGQTDENAVVTPGATDIVRGDLFALGKLLEHGPPQDWTK